MSDDKKDSGTDFEKELAKIVNKKSHKRSSNNIYERFIDRVHSSKGAKQNNAVADPMLLDSTNENVAERLPFKDESSAQEQTLELLENITTNATFDFSNQNPATRNDTSNTKDATSKDDIDNVLFDNYPDDQHLADSDEEKSLSATDQATYTPSILSDNDFDTQIVSTEPNDEEVTKTKTTVKSSKQPIILGMVFGSLLIAAIVFMLIFTGILSTSTSDDESNNRGSETKIATDSLPVVSAEPVATNDDNQLAADTNDSDTPLESATQDAPNNGKGTPAEEPIELTSETESAITYEDFRQESQTTLYREASD
ncbi:hypothetical protein ACQKCF_08160 [Psychrobacter proteolyticus]|uniref:hypothetical protein n=1 Tax=Psychrobacter proteolyticus TaxID=147825 RepID=UPI003D08DDF6